MSQPVSLWSPRYQWLTLSQKPKWGLLLNDSWRCLLASTYVHTCICKHLPAPNSSYTKETKKSFSLLFNMHGFHKVFTCCLWSLAMNNWQLYGLCPITFILHFPLLFMHWTGWPPSPRLSLSPHPQHCANECPWPYLALTWVLGILTQFLMFGQHAFTQWTIYPAWPVRVIGVRHHTWFIQCWGSNTLPTELYPAPIFSFKQRYLALVRRSFL